MAVPLAPRRVVVATGNRGKVRELRAAISAPRLALAPQSDFGIAPAPEHGATFVENALAKARHAASSAALPAIADDSGLVVPALGGAPGIRSARYAGEDATDAANNAKLLAALAGVADRAAYFYCALVYLASADDPVPIIATARWRGVLVDAPRGAGGFGYDPHFLLPDLGQTAAELPLPRKNALSHRGQAARKLAAELAARP